jgi:hypothetical protein
MNQKINIIIIFFRVHLLDQFWVKFPTPREGFFEAPPSFQASTAVLKAFAVFVTVKFII